MPLTPERRAFLEELHYAIIATLNADGSIQQTVVWYLLDGDQLRFNISANSIKARNLRRSHTLSVTIEDSIRYLTLSGTAIVEPLDQELRERLALRYLGAERMAAWLARRPDLPRASVRMTITRAYGQGV